MKYDEQQTTTTHTALKGAKEECATPTLLNMIGALDRPPSVDIHYRIENKTFKALLKWQFRVEKIGRRHNVLLTDEGLNVLKFLYTKGS